MTGEITSFVLGISDWRVEREGNGPPHPRRHSASDHSCTRMKLMLRDIPEDVRNDLEIVLVSRIQ
jgi:hypothetical protein